MRSRSKLQQQFIDRCLHTNLTLDQVMLELNIMPEHVARWLTRRDFRRKLGKARRHARRMREVQIELGAWRAAQVLVKAAVGPEANESAPVTRQACSDLIKLARDARARTLAQRQPTQGRFFPDLPDEERRSLVESLASESA